MKIGDLPEVTTPFYTNKIALEETGGRTKKASLLNVVKSALGYVPCISYNTVDSIFATHGTGIYTNATITSAQLNGFGKVCELIVTISTNADVSVGADGKVSVGTYGAINCGALKSVFIPKSTAYGVVSSLGYFGVCNVNSEGGIVAVQFMNSWASRYTIPSGTSLTLYFHYLSDGNF